MKEADPQPTPPAGEIYHLWYYKQKIWMQTSFLGVPCQKFISDLWNYQEIIHERKPALIIEFGTYNGGSTLFFAKILAMVTTHFRVLTVDIDASRIDARVRREPHIEVLTCSSTEPQVAARIRALRAEYPGPLFAILDSSHQKEHVLGEMKLLRTVTTSDDYVVVEDTNINGHPVLPNWGDGPMEALRAYEAEFPHDYLHDSARENKFGFTAAPQGFLIRR
jgi:cephalosporin hydroxylase